MKWLFGVLALVTCAGGLSAQQTPNFPVISFDDNTVELQTSLYPTYYQFSAATDDALWLKAHSAELTGVWQQWGDSLLGSLGRLSGIPWDESQLTISLVRYYPTIGAANPFILPVGGVRVGALTEAMPRGNSLLAVLIYDLAQRLLWQGMRGHSDVAFGLANHPLMQPGPFYRDLVAMHLALAVASEVLGQDSAQAIAESGFWQRQTPGHELWEQYLKNRWQLSSEKPLVEWLAAEPPDSKLLQIASPLSRSENPDLSVEQSRIEGIPPTGKLGISLGRDTEGQLRIEKIDQNRLAYKAGFREGDVVTRVAGRRLQSHRDFIEELLAGLERGTVSVQVSRNGKTETIVVHR